MITKDLHQAIAAQDVARVRQLLARLGRIPEDSDALRGATAQGNTDLVALLAPLSSARECTSALLVACDYDRADLIAVLLPFSDPTAGESKPLRVAALRGQEDLVDLLLPVSSPTDSNSLALRWAASKGYASIVAKLLPVSDLADAWTTAVAHEEWPQVDALSALMPLQALRPVLDQVPAQAATLPQLRARVLEADLAMPSAPAAPRVRM